MNEPDPGRSSAARSAVPPTKSLRRQTFSIVPEPLKVSAVLIVLNGERHLDRVLTALSFCAEVLIVDSGSTDATRAISERHGARIEHQPFLGYGPHNRRAEELDTHDMV